MNLSIYLLKRAVPADIAGSSKIGSLNIIMGVVRGENVLKYQRNFYFGGGGQLLFPVKVYQPLKNLFDAFHKANSHSVSLIQK